MAVDDRRGHRVRDAGWRTAVTRGVLVWLAVKAAMAVLAVLVRGVAEIITFGASTDTSAVR